VPQAEFGKLQGQLAPKVERPRDVRGAFFKKKLRVLGRKSIIIYVELPYFSLKRRRAVFFDVRGA
jgi:hypothetical protein